MKKQKTKKVLAMLLAVSLLMPMLPILPGMSTTVYAEETDVTQFATKDQLTEDFNLKGDRVGRIKFGAGNREWYIAGKDPDTQNSGLVLMCDPANPLATDQQFSSNLSEKQYKADWGCTYASPDTLSMVNANHYGGSDLRAALKELETDSRYFSPSEQDLMQETTITTNDTKNQTTYTTTDKLYAAYGEEGSQYITVGTNAAGNLNGGLKINLTGNSPYAKGSDFWLRSPYDFSDDYALLALPGFNVLYYHVFDANAVVPAFNLNLSSVLFASAAPAASSTGALTIEDNAAMTLRYMPTPDKSLGTAIINSAKNSVSVSGVPEGTYLVVQNGSGAWAKAVSGNKTITAGEIYEGLTSFADCKVWLETTNTDRITTAVMAEGYEVNITNPPDSHITRSTAEGNGAEIQSVAYGIAIKNVVYTADIGYYFPENYSVTAVNGINVTRDNDGNQITISGTPTADATINLVAASVKGKEEQTAPTGLSYGVKEIGGTSTAMEYAATADATEWTTCTEGTTAVEAGIWYVRYKETDTKQASPSTLVLVSETAGSTKFSTKEELTTNFNLNGGTVGRIKFGANSREWLIAGLDNMGTDKNKDDDTLALLSASSFGDSTYGSNGRYVDSTIANTVLPGYYTSHFSSSEKEYMAETTVSTEDWTGTPSVVNGNLYIPDAAGGRNGKYSTIICVGTNNNISIALSRLVQKNGFTSSDFWLRSPYYINDTYVLLARPDNSVFDDYVNDAFAVVPAFKLNLSSVLFASAAPAASSEGALTAEDAMTLRYMPAAGTSLGTAAINLAQNGIGVSGAPEGTYLVVQNNRGAWAKAVSGNKTITASEINKELTSFADCKVWLEKTDTTDRITTAVMAVQGHETKITNPPDSHITRSTEEGNGEATQIVVPRTAITDVVYTADSGYYFPEEYIETAVNGISVTRNSPTQITVSGTPTADATITLTAATAKEEQTAPTGLSDGIEKIDGTKTAMEYAATANATKWTTCTESTTAVEAGTWYVRYKETDTKKASPATVITVTAPSYTITTDPAVLNFDSVNLNAEGSYIQPEEKTVTIENKGNSAVTLTKPDSTSYTIGELSKATLDTEERATFTVQPKANLTAGTYRETLEVTTDEGAKTTVALSFTVNGAFSVTIDPASAEIIAGQSQTLTANLEGGSGNYTYAWYAGNEANVIGSENKISVSPTTTTTYKVVVTDTIEKKDATATVTVIPATYTITTDPAALNFDSVNLDENGSYIQPDVKTVTVKNTGNSEVTLTKPASTSYTIGDLSKATLNAEESATFTVQPNANLTAGTYSEPLEVTTNEGAETTVALSFTVNGAFSVTIDPASAEIIAGQSQTLTANPEGGSGKYTYAWYAGSEKKDIGTAKEITVSPATTTTYKVVVTDTIEKKDATATVTVIAPTYTITTDPAALNFGTVNQDDKGSYTQPDAQTVTVTNTGNSAVTLTKPDSTGYTIGELSKAALDTGERATFTIQPKGDLSTGTYSETLKVTTDKGTEAEVTVNFTVKAKTEDASKVIKGADSKWTKGSKDGLSFTSNAEFDKFKKVMIDGKDIDASHYAVQSGSTIVTLKAEYLETLKAGKHTISIVSENGTADAAFTIVKGADKPAPDKQAPNKQTPSKNGKSTKVPQTGDNSNLALWLILLALCGGTIAAIRIRKKRS